MKLGFYAKIALGNLKKNRRFYVPHILTGAGLLTCFYIVLTLAMDGRLSSVKGGSVLPVIMAFGSFVTAILSAILILYTNSFLMKQRKREFGLYNILGMEKRHVGKVLFYETLISSGISVLLGLLGGVLFYKLCTLLICYIMKTEIVFGLYYITPKTLVPAALFFLGLDAIAYVFNRISISRMKPVELLANSKKGEKEPRIKWVLLVVGLAALGSGYYIALTTKTPLKALQMFFLAVLLVIIGTYCLFITGTIAVLKLLKKNKNYYYHKSHMPAVSGLLFRMKQNAVGLSSIAILSTAVLVMISTTTSLYGGIEKTLEKQYPAQLYYSAGYEEGELEKPLDREIGEDIVRKASETFGLEIEAIDHEEYLSVAYLLKGNHFLTDRKVDDAFSNDIAEIIFMTKDAFEASLMETVELSEGEIAICSFIPQFAIEDKEIVIGDETFTVVKELSSFPVNMAVDLVKSYGIVVPDKETLERIDAAQREAYGPVASSMSTRLGVTYKEPEKGEAVATKLFEKIREDTYSYMEAMQYPSFRCHADLVWLSKVDLLSMYGPLLFLGLILGLAFIFATTLIIYYKQISEGYEDRERFQIMQKIGMSEAEVRGTIRSQLIYVFLLPLFVAGMHLLFAFPILEKMLKVLQLSDARLFAISAAGVFAGFAVIYLCIYFLTTKVYYKIIH